jgi:hypothetical protein
MPDGETHPPKQWNAYICPTDVGNQMVQPIVDAPARPRPKVTPIWRLGDSHRTVLARQTMVPKFEI